MDLPLRCPVGNGGRSGHVHRWHPQTSDRTVHIPRPAPPRGFDELTDRELDVFRLVARGLSNPEIARELYISETTVKTHITHILQKLNLRDRVQAVVLAYETGLFDEARSPTDRQQRPAR